MKSTIERKSHNPGCAEDLLEGCEMPFSMSEGALFDLFESGEVVILDAIYD